MKTNRGFTLIEVVITAGILVCGLVAIASMFSFAIRTNSLNRQMAVATTLLYSKMEEFRSAPFTDPIWAESIGSENLYIGGDGYVRTWQIDPNIPRAVTVIISAQNNSLARRPTELIRAKTLISPRFE